MTLKIGNITIEHPVMLAPMSGVSDYPFRKLVKSFGAGLVFSEMIASRSVIEEQNKSIKDNALYTEEHPIAVQIAGCEPDIMAEAAKINVDRGADIIDINFGCPVKKIVKKFAGSALMKDEDLACQIIQSVVDAVNVPVTVKMRLGWDKEHLNAPSLAQKAEKLGAQMVTVHGRTRDQLYSGTADWNAVRAIKDAVNVPVVVNGDINTPLDAQKAMKQSGADGVMIGRGSCGKPWLLQQIIEFLETGNIPATPSISEIQNIVIGHYDAMLDFYGEYKGVINARKHLDWYCNGMHDAGTFRRSINTESNPDVVKQMVREFFY